MSSQALPQVLIYTDGGCDPNPGPGGWGVVLVHGLQTKELSGAAANTTNNRMELTAALSALRTLKTPCDVTLYTDSQYLRKGITQWLSAWRAHDWRKANGQPVENVDLWQELSAQADRHRVTWQWVRGHRGNPLNERADHLATEARRRLVAIGVRAAPSGRDQPREGRRRQEPPRHEAAPAALPQVELYARGSALGTPGPAGYAAVLVYEDEHSQVVARGWELATSNVMELWAVIAGLRALRTRSRVTVHTTSKYVLDGATNWLAKWERRGWRTQGGEAVKNRELWEELGTVLGDHDVSWVLLARDEANPHNMRAAQLARSEAQRMNAQQRG